MPRYAIGFSWLVLFLILFSPVRGLALDKPFDHSVWDEFLKKYVNEKGDVDYRGIKNQPELLNRYLEQLASMKEKYFERTWPREEVLALWLNAYHAAVIKTIVEHYPIRSINDISNVWSMDMIRVGPAHMNASLIRTEKLIRAFHDEKIHAALFFGAKGGPRLRNEAFTGPRVEGQLYLAAQEFVNNSAHVEIIPGQKAIRISRIFDWYGQDFVMDFGALENDLGFTKTQYAVLSFIDHYLTDPEKVRFLEDGKYKIKYLPFDWSLNDASVRGAEPAS